MMSISLSAQSVYKTVEGEIVGNEKGIMVDRKLSEREFRAVTMNINKDGEIGAIAIEHLNGKVELISLNGENLGQLKGAYSSFRGKISINLRMIGEGDEKMFILNLVRERKTIVGIIMR